MPALRRGGWRVDRVPVGQNEEFGQEPECTKVGLKARAGNEPPVEGSMQAKHGDLWREFQL